VEVGYRLQKDVPSCSSGTAQEKLLQENSVLVKFVIPK
jgi:hypothetical protein